MRSKNDYIVYYEQKSKEDSLLECMLIMMDIMWPANQSHFHLSFIFIEMNFCSLSFLCDVCNEVHEHMH